MMPQPDDPKPKRARNRKLEAARQALLSPSGAPDMCMSRQELAEAANTYVWEHTDGRQHTNMTEHDIGRYERGEVHWPKRWRRYGLRGVLRASSDTELGFYPNRKTHTIPVMRVAGVAAAASEERAGEETGPLGAGGEQVGVVGSGIREHVVNGAAVDETAHASVSPFGGGVLDRVPLANAGAASAFMYSEAGYGKAGLTHRPPRRTLLAGIAALAAACGLLGGQDRGRRVGLGDVERLSAVTALYRSVDYECGGGILWADVSRFADSASQLLDQRYSDALAPRLLAAVAAARQLAGWTAFDSCRHSDAQRHFLAAERIAVAAGDVLLAARARYCQARQFQHLRHNRDALDTLRLAREHLGASSTAAMSAMLDGAEAASLAAVGDGEQALVQLGRAEDSFANNDMGCEPDWMRFYDRGELLAQHGRVYRDLARADRRHGPAAVRSTAEAIDAFSPQNTRSSVLNEVGLCSALFLADEPEQAVAVGGDVVRHAQEIASPRVLDRLRNVRHDLARHQRVPEVAEFARTLATVGSGATR